MAQLTLSDELPDLNFRLDDTLDLETFLDQILQPVLDLAFEDLERFKKQNDPNEADENAVDAMLSDLGNPFDVALGQPLNRRRLLVTSLIQIYQTKGTVPGLVDVIRTLTGIEIVGIVSPGTIQGWVLGVHVLGDTPADPPLADPNNTDRAILGSTPGFVRYSFQVEVPRVLTQDEKDVITEIVLLVKPAHTHFLGFIEPTVTGTIEHWQLGKSQLDVNTDLHGP